MLKDTFLYILIKSISIIMQFVNLDKERRMIN